MSPLARPCLGKGQAAKGGKTSPNQGPWGGGGGGCPRYKEETEVVSSS